MDFSNLLASQRGTFIGTGKGGGKRTKGLIYSSYEIRGVSWFTRVGEEGKSGGSSD